MNLRSYLDYVAAFNSQDWGRVVGEFCAPDVRLSFPIATLNGRAEALAWYAEAHRTIFETLVPWGIRFTEDGAVVDLTVQFILLAPTDYSPLGERGEAGDVVSVSMRARYTADDQGLINSVTVEFTAAPSKEMKISKEAKIS